MKMLLHLLLFLNYHKLHLDELILPPVLVPQLQMATNKPSTTADVPLQLDSSLKLSSNEIKSRPLSLEMFNQCS